MSGQKTFKEVVDRTIEVADAFKAVEKRNWGIEGSMIELMKQVGELSKNIMVTEGYYMAGRDSSSKYQSSKETIADELSDILFMTIRIADHYGIDLEESHLSEMDKAMNHPHMKIKK